MTHVDCAPRLASNEFVRPARGGVTHQLDARIAVRAGGHRCRDRWHPWTVAFYITLRDSDGAVVRGMPDPFGGTFDASGDFDGLVQEAASPMLAGLDPYGETTLTSSDMAALATEVDDLLAAVPDRAKERRGRDATAWRALTRFRVMVSLCQADRRSTLHFLGD